MPSDPPSRRSTEATLENLRDGFEESTEHLANLPAYRSLTWGPVTPLKQEQLETGELGWARTVLVKASTPGRRARPVEGVLEYRLKPPGGGRARSSPPASRIVQRRVGSSPPSELRAVAGVGGTRPWWERLLADVRKELLEDEAE